jgi:hypothetical protein
VDAGQFPIQQICPDFCRVHILIVYVLFVNKIVL